MRWVWGKIKRVWYRIRLKVAMSMLQDLDEVMKRAGWSRGERRRFWREFIKNTKVRSRVIRIMEEVEHEI